MRQIKDCRAQILARLKRFIATTGRELFALDDKTNLIRQGMTSDEGVDFVIDLCEEFSFDFPADFNPFIHDTGRRGRTVGELVGAVEHHLRAKEATQ